MPNRLTAERAREIVFAVAEDVDLHEIKRAVNRVLAADLDARIETLEACAKERCAMCRGSSLIELDGGKKPVHRISRHGVARCTAQYEQRELTRLRKERETLTADSRTIAE